MSKPRIFMSHSCKDSDISDGIPLAREDEPRLRRLKFAKLVRDKLDETLKDRFEVLLDRNLLDPGDHWRTKLLNWLGICDGAVILLSEDSIQSKWVLQEATICTWRKWLKGSFVLVPVIIGDIPQTKFADCGFAPLQLDEIQSARLDAAAELSEANAELIAKKVADRFEGLAMAADDNEIQRWVEDVTVKLKDVDEVILKRARIPLGIPEEDWAHFPDRPAIIAHHLLFTNLEAACIALEELKSGFKDKAAFAAVVELVSPIWVHAEAASGIVAHSPIQANNAPRAFALNTQDFETAEDYLKRAYCCPSWLNRTRYTNFNQSVGEGQEEEAFDSLYCLIAKTLHVLPTVSSEIIRGLLMKHPFFVIFGEQSPLTHELRAILAGSNELKSITCLQLAGLDFETALTDPPIIRILPEIRKEDECQAQINKRGLLNLSE